jgi:hypothetical protein
MRLELGQSTAERVPVPEKAPSSIFTFDIVTLPVLVTRNEYVTVSPAVATVPGSADLFKLIAGCGGVGTTTVDGSDGTEVFDPGGVPSTVAVLVTDPEFTSASVKV